MFAEQGDTFTKIRFGALRQKETHIHFLKSSGIGNMVNNIVTMLYGDRQ